MRIAFTKMEGAGNDYIYVDAVHRPDLLAVGPDLARRHSDRHFGIGADGVIMLGRSETAPVRMHMWNADGSRGAMCGNGLRCVAALAHRLGHAIAREFAVETDVGLRHCELLFADDRLERVRAEIGAVRIEAAPVRLAAAGHTLEFHLADAGNPHAVTFLDCDPESFPVEAVGAALQRHQRFPGGVNVEFVQVRPDGSIAQRTFERGSGETLACGSGAATVAAVALATGRVAGEPVRIRLRGGELDVLRRGTSLVIEGPARTVFTGEVDLPVPRPQ